jgi:hypothetical protein
MTEDGSQGGGAGASGGRGRWRVRWTEDRGRGTGALARPVDDLSSDDCPLSTVLSLPSSGLAGERVGFGEHGTEHGAYLAGLVAESLMLGLTEVVAGSGGRQPVLGLG